MGLMTQPRQEFPPQAKGPTEPDLPAPETQTSGGRTVPILQTAAETTEPAATEAIETAVTEATEPAATETTEAAATGTTEPATTEATETVSTGATEAATTETVPETTAVTTTAATAPPAPDVRDSRLLLGGLAVAFALLAAVILVLLRRKNGAAAPAETGNAHTVPIAPATAQSASPAASTPVQVAYYQHIGAREDQQDGYAVSNPAAYDRQGVLAVVADGMGGLSNGGAVSAAVVRSFMDTFRSIQAPAGQVLLEAAARTNEHINQMLRGGEKSGSTLVAAIIRDGWLSFLSVGDSRIYLYRGGALLQLNREHAYREELAVRAVNQEIPLSRVWSDRQSHALTSFFGIGSVPHVDRNDESIRLLPGDRLLLASDGVFGALTGRQLETAMALPASESVRQIERLILQANLPNQDNNTAVVMQYNG